MNSDRGTPHLPDGFGLTDDDGADLTAVGGSGSNGVRGLGDNGSSESANDASAMVHQFRALSVFDASRTNQIWAVGAERRGHMTGDEFNTSSGEAANVTGNSLNATTPVRIGSMATSPTGVDGPGKGGISSASAPGSIPGIDIQSIWESSRGHTQQPWITENLFDSETTPDGTKTGPDGEEHRTLEEVASAATKLSGNNGNAWEWNESLQNVSITLICVLLLVVVSTHLLFACLRRILGEQCTITTRRV